MSQNEQPRSLAQLRRHRRMTQGDIERSAGMSQAAVLSAERARDPRLSTVSRFVEALGGRLQLVASFEDGDYPLAISEPPVVDGGGTQFPAWRIRAWDDPRLAERFLAEGIVAVSEDDIGRAVTEFDSDQELRRKIQEEHPERSENAIGTFVTYWRHFSRNMRIGDTIVLAYRERRGALKAAIGTVTGDYEYVRDPELDERLRHRRAVRWNLVLNRSELPEDLRRTVDAPGTIGRFGAADAGARLAALTNKAG
ncbi:hypothetical protein [Nocardia niwae]|uniref:HTH cro/C1-type domain-containing protein n=1 Tax=Nocardia niwae TaxID=626084 RepID=A0ABV2X4J9_9NOCA